MCFCSILVSLVESWNQTNTRKLRGKWLVGTTRIAAACKCGTVAYMYKKTMYMYIGSTLFSSGNWR
jgi:hypothetical protein